MIGSDISFPVVAYSILHQGPGGAASAEYGKAVRKMHSRIAEEVAVMAKSGARLVEESVTREAQMVSGALHAFLETPLKTDQEEVRRIIRDGLARAAEPMAKTGQGRLLKSSEGRIVLGASKALGLKGPLQSGKAYLEGLGLHPGGRGEMFESSYVMEGSRGLDILEHIVKSRIGIYNDPHGVYVLSTAGQLFAAYNLVLSAGKPPEGGEGTEFCLHFEKPPAMQYEEFRAPLYEIIEDEARSENSGEISLWQRKLGLGKTKEFVIRALHAHFSSAEAVSLALMKKIGSVFGQIEGFQGISAFPKEVVFSLLSTTYR